MMVQKIKNKLLILASILMFALPAAVPVAAPASVSAADIQNSVCTGADQLQVQESPTVNCNSLQGSTTDANSLITKIINILSVIVGIVAVIMIIVGGFRYITSGGASEKVTGAKNTILYAIIGLIIVALAQIIVRFVLKNTT